MWDLISRGLLSKLHELGFVKLLEIFRPQSPMGDVLQDPFLNV